MLYFRPMKTLATLFLLFPLFSCGQKYFEGEIVYSNEMIKKDSSFDLNRIPCAGSTSTVIAYKNGNFFSRLTNCYIEYQYFNRNMNKVFYKMHGIDTLYVDDYDRKPRESDTIISVKKYNNSDTILNKICNRIVIQRTKTKMTFVYSPELKLNADWYKNSKAEYYDVIYGQMQSVFLKYIIEGEGFISTAIATKINSNPIGSDIFPDVTKFPRVSL